MLSSVIFALLIACAAGYPVLVPKYSFVPPVGSGSGTQYSIEGPGRITGIRIWERYSNYIYGFQIRYGNVWSDIAGIKSGTTHEMELFEGEVIVQVSGKYGHYIQSLMFVTNMGRSLNVGQPGGYSFNMYPENKMAELVMLSGRYHGALTSIGTHWVVLDSYSEPAAPAVHEEN